jgi:hypothetical protein
MALNYDTNVELLFPSAVFEDAVCAPILDRVGIHMEHAGNKVLLFTDPRTVAALNAANEGVKEAFRKSGVGLVVYGWSQQEKAAFLIRALRKIAEEYGSNQSALRLAVFDLMRFIHDGVMGQRDDPNPFAAPLPVPPEEFDFAAALRVMTSPEQMNKP